MKERLLKLTNVVLLCLLVLILTTFQSSLWFQIFGYFAAPAFWIPALIYIFLYRTVLEAVIVAFLFCIMVSTMTAMPDALLVISALALGFSSRMFRQRIYWSNATYIMLLCGIGALLFHIYALILSGFIEESPLRSPQILDWILEALLTPLVAPAVFKIFHFIDNLTHQVRAPVASAEVV